MWKKRL